MAMGQNPNRTPSEHPNPTKIALKWVVNSPTPKWDPIGVDNHCHMVCQRAFESTYIEAMIQALAKASKRAGLCRWISLVTLMPGHLYPLHSKNLLATAGPYPGMRKADSIVMKYGSVMF